MNAKTNLANHENLRSLIDRLIVELKELGGGYSPSGVLTAPQLAHMLGIPLSGVYYLTHQRKLKFSKRGKRVYFRLEDVHNYLSKGEREPLN
jgi:excisionase family DNA binding protein